jgi:hypothetical protein
MHMHVNKYLESNKDVMMKAVMRILVYNPLMLQQSLAVD